MPVGLCALTGKMRILGESARFPAEATTVGRRHVACVIHLHIRVEELAAMGAVKDDLIGDAHDYLRDVDEKMPGHGAVVRHGRVKRT